MLVRAFSLTFDLFGFHSSSGFLSCQILPKETPTQEQEPNNPLNDPIGIEGDLVAIDTQTVDFLAQRATDGKEVICPIYSSAIIMN